MIAVGKHIAGVVARMVETSMEVPLGRLRTIHEAKLPKRRHISFSGSVLAPNTEQHSKDVSVSPESEWTQMPRGIHSASARWAPHQSLVFHRSPLPLPLRYHVQGRVLMMLWVLGSTSQVMMTTSEQRSMGVIDWSESADVAVSLLVIIAQLTLAGNVMDNTSFRSGSLTRSMW